MASQRAAAAWSTVEECRSAACLAMVSDRSSVRGARDPADAQARARRSWTAWRWRASARAPAAATPRAVVPRRCSAARRRGRPRPPTVRCARTPRPARGAAGRQRPSRGIVERRHGVEQGRAVLGDQRIERVGVQAIVVAGDRDGLGPGQREALERGEVGRLLDEHAVTGLEQDGRHQRERLLGAAGDEQVVSGGVQPALGQPLGDQPPQQRVALRGGVLQHAGAGLLAQDGGERRLESRSDRTGPAPAGRRRRTPPRGARSAPGCRGPASWSRRGGGRLWRVRAMDMTCGLLGEDRVTTATATGPPALSAGLSDRWRVLLVVRESACGQCKPRLTPVAARPLPAGGAGRPGISSAAWERTRPQGSPPALRIRPCSWRGRSAAARPAGSSRRSSSRARACV